MSPPHPEGLIHHPPDELDTQPLGGHNMLQPEAPHLVQLGLQSILHINKHPIAGLNY